MHLDETRDDKRADYEATGSMYMVPASQARPPYLGLADDNHRDGTQSFIYVALSPTDARYYGMTSIAIHEYGHHFGMSHTHDGFDYEDGVEIGPYGKNLFMWVGDEVSSIMSYLFLTNGFSQFERDNMARYMTAAYSQEIYKIASAAVKKVKNDGSVFLDLADAKLLDAREALRDHRYTAAMTSAKEAYEWVVLGAERLGVRIPADRRGTTPDGVPGKRSVHEHTKGFFSEPRDQLPMPWLEQR